MRRYLQPLALLSALLIVLTACSSDTDDTEGPAATAAPDGGSAEPMEGVGGLPLVDPLEITGDIVAAGSSTVFPLAEAMLARFEDEGPRHQGDHGEHAEEPGQETDARG